LPWTKPLLHDHFSKLCAFEFSYCTKFLSCNELAHCVAHQGQILKKW